MKTGDLVKWWTGDVPHVGDLERVDPPTTQESLLGIQATAVVLMGPGPKRTRKEIPAELLEVIDRKDGRGNPK